MSDDNWTVAEAKARFSELVARAQSQGPQTITKRGQRAVVIVSADEWQKKTRRSGNLAEFLAASPLSDSGVEIARVKGKLRDVKL